MQRYIGHVITVNNISLNHQNSDIKSGGYDDIHKIAFFKLNYIFIIFIL